MVLEPDQAFVVHARSAKVKLTKSLLSRFLNGFPEQEGCSPQVTSPKTVAATVLVDELRAMLQGRECLLRDSRCGKRDALRAHPQRPCQDSETRTAAAVADGADDV